MHGIVGAFGILILICFGLALVTSLITGSSSLKSAAITFAILLAIAIALDPPTRDRLSDFVATFPLYILGLAIGMFGALPGAAVGKWLRSRITERKL